MAEGVRISTNNFQYAVWYRRLAAYLIDKVLVIVVVMLLVPGSMLVVDLIGGRHWAELLQYFLNWPGMCFWLAFFVYFLVMWGLMSRTVGMVLMKIKVVDVNGKKIGWLKAIFRVFGLLLSEIVLFLGFLPIIFDKKRQGLHDKLTKSFVIMKR